MVFKQGFDVNAGYSDELTALHLAMVRYKDQPCPEKLLDLFIDRALADDTQDHTGCTALHEAITHNASLRIVKKLLQEDLYLDIMDNDDNTPLHLAAETLNPEVTKLLL
ncbi:hypothetical protein L873DRAFT_1794307 [Choiromyces venosus 120613-1]|uniref:Uncharacterized protein n=1 Tax=Choiromyces venosus 120613-1 TaxID=1336337 RepID=A0A3N4J7B4_9PEZI|nr:hypothetical protein L873DRAFT_1794307 [Choiromyces venosus 120613-1]